MFSYWMAQRLETLGMNQAGLLRALEAGGLKVSATSVCYWVSGKATPEADKIPAILAILGDDAEGWKAWGTSRGIPVEYSNARSGDAA